MQRVLFILIIGVVSYISYLGVVDTHSLQELNRDTIEVDVIYNNEVIEVSLSPYATLEELLETLDLGNDVDFSRLNKQRILAHRDVVTLPKYVEAPLISINNASFEELLELNGVGPSLAHQIIAYRETVGFFQVLEELLNVKGIGDKKYEGMKDFICL